MKCLACEEPASGMSNYCAAHRPGEVPHTRDDGGPAFPTLDSNPRLTRPNLHLQCAGMSLRDYFAAKAMPLARDQAASNFGGQAPFAIVAEWSYALADEMLKARSA